MLEIPRVNLAKDCLLGVELKFIDKFFNLFKQVLFFKKVIFVNWYILGLKIHGERVLNWSAASANIFFGCARFDNSADSWIQN